MMTETKKKKVNKEKSVITLISKIEHLCYKVIF